jgi:hypothetical protein
MLINEKKSSTKEVLRYLADHKYDTEWSTLTTHFAVDYINRFEDKYSSCVRGFLQKDLFLDILLPYHGHMEDFVTGIVLFPEDTSVKIALDYYKTPNPCYSKECLNHILFLKDKIKKDGFTSEVIVELVDGRLKHINGLYRMVALGLLLEEDDKHTSIPVYLLIR